MIPISQDIVPPEESRNVRRRNETRRRLVEAAARVIAEKGLDATTIKDITDAADVGFGSFYNHFESKDAIASAAVDAILTRLGQAIDAFNSTESNPLEMVAAGIGNTIRMLDEQPTVAHFLVQMGLSHAGLGGDILARLQRDVRLAADQGLLDVPHEETAVELIRGGLLHLMRLRLLGRLDDSSEVHALHMLLRLLGARDAEARRLSAKFKRFPLYEKGAMV